MKEELVKFGKFDGLEPTNYFKWPALFPHRGFNEACIKSKLNSKALREIQNLVIQCK
jgi:hypothetical protein